MEPTDQYTDHTLTHHTIGNGVDWDVVARAVSGAGVPLGPGAFFLASSFGREDSPHLAFSPKDNSFGTPTHPPQSPCVLAYC